MSELSSGVSELDARLAEIDRRLSAIQAELRPGRDARPPAAPPESAPLPAGQELEADPARPPAQRESAPDAARPPAETQSAPDPPEQADLMQRLVVLTELQERLLHSIGELLAPSQTALARLPHPSPAGTVREFTVSAGPFASTGAVRAFEAMLSGTPGVREVTVRGYEGEDRAIVDVRLADAIT
jgi:hypothetical protein